MLRVRLYFAVLGIELKLYIHEASPLLLSYISETLKIYFSVTQAHIPLVSHLCSAHFSVSKVLSTSSLLHYM